MSTGRGDDSYQPSKSLRGKIVQQKPIVRPSRTARRDYTEEIEVLLDQETSEGAVIPEFERNRVKLDPDSSKTESARNLAWTPRTFSDRTNWLNKQLTEFAEQTSSLGKAQPETNIASVLQMMMEMRAEDRKSEQQKTDEREREGRKKGEERI